MKLCCWCIFCSTDSSESVVYNETVFVEQILSELLYFNFCVWLSLIIQTWNDLFIFQQIHREAISNEEVDLAQRHLAVRNDQQHQLEDAWRSLRWLPDVINQVKDIYIRLNIDWDFQLG